MKITQNKQMEGKMPKEKAQETHINTETHTFAPIAAPLKTQNGKPSHIHKGHVRYNEKREEENCSTVRLTTSKDALECFFGLPSTAGHTAYP